MEEFEKYYLIAVNFLSYRGRSEKEVRDKIKSKNASDNIADQVLLKLREQRFVDDEQFAKDWVRSRTTYRLKSKRIIKFELIKKGINPDIIEKVLSEGADEDTGKFDDLAQAKKIAEKRIEKYRGLSKQEIYQKLGGFLARRGFDWETIKAAIDQSM